MNVDGWIATKGYQRYRKAGKAGEEQDRLTRDFWGTHPYMEDEEFRELLYDAIRYGGITPIEKAYDHTVEQMENDYISYEDVG